MKKVKDTKGITIRQMISMAENLREKFKVYSSIDISANLYISAPSAEMKYSIYVEKICYDNYKTWQELLSAYHKMMGETKNE